MRLSTADTVESAMPRHSAISEAVIRKRRSSSMTSTRSTGVRCGMWLGADERSRSPSSPRMR
jgi:hypothetical protein